MIMRMWSIVSRVESDRARGGPRSRVSATRWREEKWVGNPMPIRPSTKSARTEWSATHNLARVPPVEPATTLALFAAGWELIEEQAACLLAQPLKEGALEVQGRLVAPHDESGQNP